MKDTRMPPNQKLQRGSCLILGAAVWVAAAALIASSVFTVHARISRATYQLQVKVPPAAGLLTGDAVYLATDSGLERIGEVLDVAANQGLVRLAIEPEGYGRLNQSTQAACWRTPLSAEDAITALLPPATQTKAAERIGKDWREQQESLTEVWQPLIVDLALAYLRIVGDDVEASFERHRDELRLLTHPHGMALAAAWPTIQERLNPILEEHLTPVLARLLSDAVADAPKMEIAIDMAKGRNDAAFQRMLNWLAEYLARIPEADREKLRVATRSAWQAARNDPVLVGQFARIGRGLVEDEKIRETLTEVYREAMSENPRTAEFVRREILESPEIRRKVYALIEAFAPTARAVLTLCLFDENGTTRPEVVHLVRSAALGRTVAWITLTTADSAAAPLPPDAVITARAEGAGQ